jgi:integrase
MRGTITPIPPPKDDLKRLAWRITIPLGKDPSTGKYRRLYETVIGSRRDGERKQTELLRALDTSSLSAPSRLTVAVYLNQWLSGYVATRIDKPKTAQSYRMIVTRHLIPRLGHIKLARLTPADVQKYYGDTLAGGRIGPDGKPTGKSLSSTTVAHRHAVLHDALEHALKQGLVGRNVAHLVDPPRIKRTTMKTWSDVEVRRVLDVAKNGRYYAVFVLALTTGLRAGEIFGLRWEDVDLTAGTLTVNQTLEKPGPSATFGRPKSESSRRTLPLSEACIDALRRHRATQNTERLRLGAEWHDFDLVFTVFDGKPLRSGNFRRDVYDPLIVKARVPRIRFHDMRHSHATLLLTAGVHPKVVSERLGHSGIALTLDTYSHVMPGMQKEASEAIDRRLFGAS